MRYLLDTVTISELRRNELRINPAVGLRQRNVGDQAVRRKDVVFASILTAWYAQIIAQPKRFRILNVDRAIAELAADFRAAYGTPFEDSLIAATAEVHALTLATRNTADFEATGILLMNPWAWEG